MEQDNWFPLSRQKLKPIPVCTGGHAGDRTCTGYGISAFLIYYNVPNLLVLSLNPYTTHISFHHAHELTANKQYLPLRAVYALYQIFFEDALRKELRSIS
jgi:hypothetical protein